jgi:hypothetical protein
MIEIKRQEIEEIEPIEAFNDFFSSPMMSLLRLPNPRCVKMDDGDGGRPPWWLGTSLGCYLAGSLPLLSSPPEIRVYKGFK